MNRGSLAVGMLVGVLALLSGSGLRAEERGGDAQAFERAVERIHGCCKKEQFKSALRKLESLLRKHERQSYARARRAELEDLAERISFGLQYEAPDVDDVVSGRVEKWDCEKGYLHVRYTPTTDGDLDPGQGGWTRLPGTVTGPFLLEVTGNAYPGRPSSAPRMLLSGGIDPRSKRPQSWLVVFGTPRREIGDRIEWMPARILHYDGERERKIVQLDDVPIEAGVRFKVQLKVTKSLITVGINGKTMFNRRRSKNVYGLLGFDVRGWSQVRFAGTIEPGWIQERLDELAQAELREFRKRYKRTRYLPSWLFEDPAPTDAAPAPSEPEAPVAVEGKHQGAIRRAKSLIDEENWVGAKRAIAALERAGAPPAITAHLSARVRVGSGELTRGLEELDVCLRAAPDFLDALLLKAKVLRRLGRTDEAYRTFRYAIKRHRREPRAYETAAISMLYAARPDAAQTVTEMAVQGGVSSPDLELVARMVVKAVRGPMWNQTFEYRSRNYHVLSDISKETCIEAARILEEALIAYRVNLHWVTRDKSRLYPVYVFSGRQGFHEYMSEFSAIVGLPSENVAGLYNPLLKQLVIWHLPNRDEMLEVIRHEGFHQYLDRLMPDAPVWFNEGLAVYHQNAEKKRGKLHFGAPHAFYLEVLREKELVPLEEFLSWSHEEFYAAAPLSYAQAWALMHLLKEGKPKHRSLFKKLVEDFQSEPPSEVIRKRFPPASLGRLTTALQGHIGGLRKR